MDGRINRHQYLFTRDLKARAERPPRPAITGLADRGERPPTSSQRAQPGATAPGHSPNGRARRPERRATACALVSIPAAISGLSWRSCRRFGPGLVASRDCAAGQARAGAPDGAIGRTPCKPRDRTTSRTPRPWKRCCSSTPEAPSGAPAFACPVVQSRDATNPGPRRRRDSRKSHDVPTEMRPEDRRERGVDPAHAVRRRVRVSDLRGSIGRRSDLRVFDG